MGASESESPKQRDVPDQLALRASGSWFGTRRKPGRAQTLALILNIPRNMRAR